MAAPEAALDNAAWAAVVTGLLSEYRKGSMTTSKVRKRAVKAAQTRAPGASKAALKAGFERFLQTHKPADLKVQGDRIGLVTRQKATAAAGAKRKQPEAAASEGPPAKKQAVGNGKAAAEQQEGGEAGDPSGKLPGKSPGKKHKQQAAERGEEAEMPAIGGLSWRESHARADVKHGRFSKQERALLREAAVNFAQERGLSDSDFSWLYETRTGSQRKLTAGAWKAIAEALPHRTVNAVYRTGTRMLHAHNAKGRWSAEDTARLLQLVAELGRRWVKIGQELERLHWDCRDRYREVTSVDPAARRSGAWSPEESAALQAAVDEYMQARQELEEGRRAEAAELAAEDLLGSPGGSAGGSAGASKPSGRAEVVLDDIDWQAVAARVGTRSRQQCMQRWYRCLAPSMVSRGEWGSGDDRRLLKGLLRSGAREDFAVAWGELVPGRSEQQARRRWKLMLKRVPDRAERGFGEQLDYLVDTFTPGLRAKLGLAPPPAKDT